MTAQHAPRAEPGLPVEAATVDPVEDDGLRIVCAWCGSAVSGAREAPVSHGICAGCARRFLDQLPLAYLASIADADGTVTLFSGYRFEVAALAPGAAAERDSAPRGTA